MEDSISRQFQSLERKVKDLEHGCEERNAQASRKIDQAIKECAKQRDFEGLARDLAQLKRNEKETTRVGQRKEFFYDESKKLEGIIAYLTREYGGNVHDKGIVNITASGVTDGREPKNVANLGKDGDYCSKNEQNSWICYDFKDRRVIPRSYSIMTYCGGRDSGHHLQFWVIEGSNDGTENSWTEVDRREKNSDLKNPYATANFRIANVPSEGFRFLRLRQTGKDHRGYHFLVFCSLELFGTLCEK